MSSRPASRPSCSVIVPLWNQWPMTEAFLRSWSAGVRPGTAELIFVDNASSDATPGALPAWQRRLGFQVLRNRRNLGCAPAWNQGLALALRQGSPWIGVFNNDLLLGPGLIERLQSRADDRGWDFVSPATREGALNYDVEAYAPAYTARCHAWNAPGWSGWCFLGRREAFQSVGQFDERYELGIGEDEDFFRRAGAAGLKAGITGSAFVHHFGSASLGALRLEQGRGFEEKNLARLRARWGRPLKASPLASLGKAARRAWQSLRWSHQLKE